MARLFGADLNVLTGSDGYALTDGLPDFTYVGDEDAMDTGA